MTITDITDYGFFTVVPPPPDNMVLLFANEEGQDWYELRATLTNWNPANGAFIDAIFPSWAMVDADGIVTNVEFDPSMLMPGDRRVLGINAPIEDVHPGMIWNGSALEEPA